VILIGLGGNLPSSGYHSPCRTLAAALAALAGAGIGVAARSAWYRSEPVPPSDQPWYVNAVALLATERDPFALLAAMQRVELQFGRVRGGRVYGDWPGLATAQLYQGRDLAVTIDYRAALAVVLERHLRLDDRQLSRIFPDLPPARSNLGQMLAA